MKVLLVIFGIALCVAISHYIDYKKTDRYYNSIDEIDLIKRLNE